MKKAIAVAVFCIQVVNVIAQQEPSFYKGIQGRIHYGFIFAHSEHVQNTKGAHPRGIEVEFFRQKVDTSSWDACNCYPVKGWSLSYFDFNSRILGHSVNAAYFLEPAYRIGRKVQFRFRGGFGLSYLTNPFDSVDNPTNMSYSTNISGYLQLGVGATYKVAPGWLVQVGAQYQHISNGGIKEPNKGINWPTASAGLTWMPANYQLPVYKKRLSKQQLDRKPYFEVGAWISAKQGRQVNGTNRRVALGGLVIQASKQVGRISALNVGAEVSYDHSLLQKLQVDSLPGSPIRAGIVGGHEFILGRFYFSQQLGVYVFNNTPYYPRLYHRWALRYQLNNRWLAGFGLKAHKQVADYIDLRATYRFN